jgi:hypothetical protein
MYITQKRPLAYLEVRTPLKTKSDGATGYAQHLQPDMNGGRSRPRSYLYSTYEYKGREDY